MLCEIDEFGNFATTWIALTLIGFLALVLLSGAVFHRFYWQPTFEQWQRKTNPKYPSPRMIQLEIIQMCKGLASATLNPALSLWMAKNGWTKAYCGFGGHSLLYNVGTFFLIWLFTDFYEFFYHRLGHTTQMGWANHKHHHRFYNPSPFAVIADEYVDQFVRALPLVFLPMAVPMNLDLLFFTYAIFFYGYGVYLHWGYELAWPDAHHPIINSAYHHYLHHAKSVKGKPYYTGFFFKIWDQLWGSQFEGSCLCVKCQPARTLKEFHEIEKHDYSCLLSVDFWLDIPQKL
ncbi:c-5 sterol desaturase [Kappamyces sp. JEL0829]|nr:c-5 sterol desaturase [Kappamyces sp. JEL0829]